jgi:hypothetical protein
MNALKYMLFGILVFGLPLLAGNNLAVLKSFPIQQQKAFKVGEELNYRVHYGLIEAGVATIQVKKQTTLGGVSVYHLLGTGRSIGITEWLFKTRDVYQSYVDTKTLLPLRFIRDVNEGGYIIKRDITFDRDNNTAKDAELKKDTIFTLPANVHDIFSAFYYARNLNVANIQPGDIIELPVFLDHEIFPFKIKFVGRDMVKTKFGKIKCLKFVPVVQKGRVFEDEDDMHLWISDDNMHVPIRIKSELLVGSIKIDLESYSGLAGQLTFSN